jgi:hypothetical protein
MKSVMATPKVFISYNHGDRDWAERIKGWLEQQGVDIRIDWETIEVGEFIQDFIDRSFRDTDFLLSIISRKSLRSGWVGFESVEGLFAERLLGTKILPIAIDDAFTQSDIVDTIAAEIDEQLDAIHQKKSQRQQKNLGTEELDDERERLMHLRSSISRIIRRLRKTLTLPLRDTDFENGMQQLLNRIQKGSTSTKSSKSLGTKEDISLFHKYTCDRYDQFGGFESYYLDEETVDKAHFFYLHGCDLQAHLGLFRRIVGFVEGKSSDFVNWQNPQTACAVFSVEVVLPLRTDFKEMKSATAHSIFKELGVSDQEMKPILTKKLGFCLSEECSHSTVKGFKAKDRICILLSVTEHHWYDLDVQRLATWFIEYFVGDSLPASGPEWYFFFSIEYDEKSDIGPEIQEVLNDAKYTRVLPELNMVRKADVQLWFRNRKKLGSSRDRKNIFRQYFQDEEEEMYMEDVQELLEKVIINAKQTEKNVDRNP